MRTTTAASRAACAEHAASVLLAWEWPEDASADWNPSPAQVIDKTRALYSWVTITEDEARAAIAEVTHRQLAASVADLPGYGQTDRYPSV